MNRRQWLLGCAGLGAASTLPACAQSRPDPSDDTPYTPSVYARDLEQPWGLAFLPDRRLLVTEKPGRLRIVSADGRAMQSINGVPEVADAGQGGLLGIAVDPAFERNGFVYLSFSEAEDTGKAGTAVARGKLNGNSLSDVRIIWRQTPKVEGHNHWGSRIVFGRDGNLFVTTGDRQAYRDLAQDLGTTIGKVVRIRPDGSAPPDNPFVNRPGARPEIWSYGHRNIQGATLHPQTGEMWLHEHGPQGGDEINIARAGKNYGWPLITNGEEYGGGRIGTTQQDGLEQPLHDWTPSIAPSGMVFYTGRHKPWQGKLFVGSLKFQYLDVITLDGEKVVSEEKWLEAFNERVRDVIQGPDGALYVAFDSADGRILRLEPK